MKRIAVILMICIYALSSLGLGVRQFYCCGKIKSTTIGFAHEAKEKCGMDDGNSGCCKTEFKSLKIEDNHVAADDISNPAKHFTDVHLYTPSIEIDALALEPRDIANASHAPPVLSSISIYVLNCNFRI